MELARNSEANHHIGNLLWPVTEGKMTSKYGHRKSRFHDGIDIVKFRKAPVFAAHDAVVIRADEQFRGYGKLLILKGQGLITMYAHLDEFTVQLGMRVQKGEQIGLLGATGRVTAPHLHFETRILNDKKRFAPIDPLVFYDKK